MRKAIGAVIAFYIVGILTGTLLHAVFLQGENTAPAQTSEINLSCPAFPTINISCPQANCTCTPTPCYDTKNIYTDQLTEMAQSMYNERPYKLNVWDCSDMSSELAIRYRNAGYNCNDVCGIYLNGTSPFSHCWVTCNDIIIETTRGRVIDGWEKANYQ